MATITEFNEQQITTNPDLKFDSLQDEEFRVYVFDENTDVFIDNPVALNVSKSGGHRVLDSKGFSHYIPSGWKHLMWKVRPGNQFFAF